MNEFSESMAWLTRAENTIPLGSQTFSKSKMSVPLGSAPLYATKAQGARFTDLDGNEYLDFVNGLLCINLGYKDKDVDNAIKAQLEAGITFSLPHTLEAEVAELMVQLIPCAEMVRFGKNGSDATSAAIRISRAFTQREHIAVCGYHGWQDWYIGSTTRDLGVPEATKQLTHKFTYNDLDSLRILFADKTKPLAAVIMEPMNIEAPKPGFLQEVKQLCEENGAILIFDEMITGFRFHLGGAQSYFGVTPHLATFGKGMANGMPISAIVGRKDIMLKMNDVFFSGTFGGETLSLAAAKASLEKLQSRNVIEHIWQLGQRLIDGFHTLNPDTNYFGIKGLAPWSFLHIENGLNSSALSIKSWLIQELCLKGIYFIGTHNLSFAHTHEDVEYLLDCYQELLPKAIELDKKGDISNHLLGAPIENVFKVR